MKKNRFFGLVFDCLCLFTACAVPGRTSGNSTSKSKASAYHKIPADEAKKMMDAGGAFIVDVRTPEEYAEAHIPGAVNVPGETIESTLPSSLPDQNAVYLVYCYSGARSKQAAEKLVGLGYESIYDFGGIADWPYEMERGE